MDIETERATASENFNRLVENMPSKLEAREERFAEKIQRSKVNRSKKLDTLYSFMNELHEYAARYTACKKGCSFCCYYPVTVSEIEIRYIEENTKHKKLKKVLPKREFHGEPCPFLKNGSCSIYDSRPYVCRRHVALTNTNTWCNPELSNDEEFPLLRFTSADEAFDSIRVESESFEMLDIRQVFKSGA